MTPAQQAHEVERVKRAESGMIASPVTVRSSQSLRETLAVMNEHDINNVPIVDGEIIISGRQCVYFVELDGPLRRTYFIHMLGE